MPDFSQNVLESKYIWDVIGTIFNVVGFSVFAYGFLLILLAFGRNGTAKTAIIGLFIAGVGMLIFQLGLRVQKLGLNNTWDTSREGNPFSKLICVVWSFTFSDHGRYDAMNSRKRPNYQNSNRPTTHGVGKFADGCLIGQRIQERLP